MTETTAVIDWNPTWEQAEMLEDERRYQIFLGGVGSGKTVLGCMWSIHRALSEPGSVGVIIAPTYTLIRDVIWLALDAWLPKGLVVDFSAASRRITFDNGSMIMFRTADNPRTIERLRGMTISWFWVDEVTLVPKMVWDILIGRIRQPGFKHGGLLTGTPKMNWVYTKFIESPDDETMHILKEVPTTANVYLTDDYVESLEKEYSGLFYEQEVLGKFVAFEGLVYLLLDEHIREPVIKTESGITKPIQFERILYGVDFGFTNPSAIAVIGKYLGTYYLIDEFYQRQVTDNQLIDVLQGKISQYGNGTVWCDPSAPGSIQKMKDAGIKAVKANNDIISGIRNQRTLMDTFSLFISPQCKNFISEIREYVWDDNEKRERPVPINDHMLDSVRYCLLSDSGQRKLKSRAVTR